jgi:hypothetical protein
MGASLGEKCDAATLSTGAVTQKEGAAAPSTGPVTQKAGAVTPIWAPQLENAVLQPSTLNLLSNFEL